MSDVTKDFIYETKSKGLDTIEFNVLEDDFKEKYSAVFCWRVLVHFTKEDVYKVLDKVYKILENDGTFIFNVMNKDIKDVDEEWVDFSNEYHMGEDRFLQDIIPEIEMIKGIIPLDKTAMVG